MATARLTAEACVDAGFAFLRYLRAQAPDAEVSLAQMRVLHLLNLRPDASLGDLADDLHVASPGLSKMVDALADRGLLERTTAPDDRRRLSLRLTPAGLSLLARRKEALVAGIEAALAKLPASQRDAILASMQTVRQAVGPKSPAVTA